MKMVRDFIKEAKVLLRQVYDEQEVMQLLFLVLEDVKGFSRTDMQMRADEFVDKADAEKLSGYVGELLTHKPIQYVLGHAWFYGMKFGVNENVLIPRPETEELCGWILSGVPQYAPGISIMDIGTGSGCIAIALKKNLPSATIHAVDISAGALWVARQNAESNAAEIIFQHGDVLSGQWRDSVKEKFDVIVSNPPYVRKSEMNAMAKGVWDFEPHGALFVEDDDPLLFYRAIADFAQTHLRENGRLFFEINAALGKAVKEMLTEKGFEKVELKTDISGNERMIYAILNPLIP